MDGADRGQDVPAAPDEGLPPELQRYLAAFSAGRYWEAHEFLEPLWWQRELDPFLQGLILLAAAHHKLQSGGIEGARRHFLSVVRYLDGFAGQYCFDVGSIVAHARRAAERIASEQRRIAAGGTVSTGRGLTDDLAPPPLRPPFGAAACPPGAGARQGIALDAAVRRAVAGRAASGLPVGPASWGALVKEVALLTRGTVPRAEVRSAVRAALAGRSADGGSGLRPPRATRRPGR